jgi:trimethylamine--corrinoid protein Co-methyltransferase
MTLLEEVGIHCEYKKARQIFKDAGANVDDEKCVVKIPESLVMKAVSFAPSSFTLNGSDGTFSMLIGEGQTHYAGLGTPTRIIDPVSSEIRETSLADVIRHIQLIDSCKLIHNSQMDIWPHDIEMTTIHTRSIMEWARWSKKSFGLGCYGFLPTLDMMRLMSILCGGKQALRDKPSFLAICSVLSPLKMATIQLEGMFICAEYGQPMAISPEAIAGATAPVTLAGLLAQENAAILAHIALAQLFRPGCPVLYGTVSTIANMRHGNVALGSIETGIITAASAQLARRYNIPCRSVGGVTEAKLEDIQAGIERTATLFAAVQAGVNLITCAGTLDGTMMESDALLLIDDDSCGMMDRMARGIEVNEDTLALDLIRQVNFTGNYFAEEHTAFHYKKEHFQPKLMQRSPFDIWKEQGSRSVLDIARERVHEIEEKAIPIMIDPSLWKEANGFCKMVAARTMEEFYAGELDSNQDWRNV